MRQFLARWWRTDPLEKFERETLTDVKIGLNVTLTAIGYNIQVRGYVEEIREDGNGTAYVIRPYSQ